MNTIKKCQLDKQFVQCISSLELPKNKQSREHILYIFGIRQVERQKRLKGENAKVALNELMRDNLNTISFFKLAELVVREAFKKVRQARMDEFAKHKIDIQSCLRDISHSEYLIVELISRIIYKYVSESPKRREDYYEALKNYYEDHPFFMELQHHIAKELQSKSFQTKEHWKALGANPKEGHVGLIDKCILPTHKMGQCIINCEKYGDVMGKVIKIIENNLNI